MTGVIREPNRNPFGKASSPITYIKLIYFLTFQLLLLSITPVWHVWFTVPLQIIPASSIVLPSLHLHCVFFKLNSCVLYYFILCCGWHRRRSVSYKWLPAYVVLFYRWWFVLKTAPSSIVFHPGQDMWSVMRTKWIMIGFTGIHHSRT